MTRYLVGFTAGLVVFCAAQAQAQTAVVNDKEISAIVITANQGEIEAGKLAKSNAGSQEVKAFAQRMVTDHTSMNQSATTLTQKLQIEPEENDTSREMKETNEKSLKALQELKGSSFDKAYIADQITMHKQVLTSIDKTLLPNAKNPELKAMLTKARGSVALHLQHAEQLQKKLQ